MRDDVKSPLKAAPLRVAVQSLSEQLIDNAFDRILGPYIFAALFVALAVSEWMGSTRQQRDALPADIDGFALWCAAAKGTERSAAG